MQRYTIFFITVNALHLSGGYSAHHQELKNCTHSIWHKSNLLAATASGSSKKERRIILAIKSLLTPERKMVSLLAADLEFFTNIYAQAHVSIVTQTGHY
jgi:hypothetical protein